MTHDTRSKPATYDDILALPDHAGNDLVSAEPFEAIELSLRLLWVGEEDSPPSA